MKKWILFLAVITTLLSPVSHGGYMAYGHGTKSCGTWTNERSTEDISLDEAAMRGWVLGFLGGVAWTGIEHRGADSNGMLAWIDNYCQANPLDNVSDAAAELAIELAKTK